MTEHARPEPLPEVKPCPDCGQSEQTHLTVLQALALFGYGKSDCPTCYITQWPRRVNEPRYP